MDPILTYKGSVMPNECDTNNHMNVMYYINKYEHAARNFFHTVNGLSELVSQDVGLAVLEQNIKYLKEVFVDDILYINSRLTAVGNKTLTVEHIMYHGVTHDVVSTISIVTVLFDKVKRKAIALPEQNKATLSAMLG